MVMDYIQKQDLIEILHDEFKDRPLNSDLEKFASKEDLERLENKIDTKFATKEDLKALENKIDRLDEKINDMGQTIVDAIERGMSVKADKSDVEDLSRRVNTLEIEVLAN
jgi:polyhydroxyalkanoate synthesis regulator phasin